MDNVRDLTKKYKACIEGIFFNLDFKNPCKWHDNDMRMSYLRRKFTWSENISDLPYPTFLMTKYHISKQILPIFFFLFRLKQKVK